MQNLRDFLFLLYSHPISTASEEILFCMNRHYEMLIPSWYLEISFLQIQIGFEIDGLMWAYPCGYTLFEFEQESISWKILAFVLWLGSSKIISMTYVEGYIYIYIYLRYDLIDCVRPANSNRYGRGKYTEKEVIFDLISQWSGPVSPFSYDELMNCWHQSYILFLWTGGKVGAQREEDCTTRERRGQPVPKRQHGFWKCSCTLTSIQIKKYFHPRRSIFAR
jgi:hypothetical protein